VLQRLAESRADIQEGRLLLVSNRSTFASAIVRQRIATLFRSEPLGSGNIDPSYIVSQEIAASWALVLK